MSVTDEIIAALQTRKPYLTFEKISLFGDVEGEFKKAYRADPKLTYCVTAWNGNRIGGQGILKMKTGFQLQLTYLDGLPPYNEIQLDDKGDWTPCKAYHNRELPDTAWVITTDIQALYDRVNSEMDALCQAYPAFTGFTVQPMTSAYNGYSNVKIVFRSILPGVQIRQLSEMADRAADSVLRREFGGPAAKSLPEVVRAFLAFSYLQQTCSFNELADNTKNQEKPADAWTHLAYGPLCRREGIAKGIAMAYQLLLRKLGLECTIINGWARDDDQTVAHSWCLVRIGSDWFHVDPTYGINSSGVDITRFMLNDSHAVSEYIWDTSRYPQCRLLRPNYSDVSAYVDRNLNALIARGIEEQYLSDDLVE